MNRDRFQFFPCSYLESDLLIGISRNDFRQEMATESLQELTRLRRALDEFIGKHPEFARSLDPPHALIDRYRQDETCPDFIRAMLHASERSGTGPMSAVAGAIAEAIGRYLSRRYHATELIVENGGDLYTIAIRPFTPAIHAGKTALSDRIGLDMPPGAYGICTSSGTLGHSLSMGAADALTVVCEDAALADAWATSLANRIMDDRIEEVLELSRSIEEIRACVILSGGKTGIAGQFPLKVL